MKQIYDIHDALSYKILRTLTKTLSINIDNFDEAQETVEKVIDEHKTRYDEPLRGEIINLDAWEAEAKTDKEPTGVLFSNRNTQMLSNRILALIAEVRRLKEQLRQRDEWIQQKDEVLQEISTSHFDISLQGPGWLLTNVISKSNPDIALDKVDGVYINYTEKAFRQANLARKALAIGKGESE